MVTRRDRTIQALIAVQAERERQHAKHGVQTLPDGAGTEPWDDVERDAARLRCDRATLAGTLTWRHVLEEEVAEALAETDPAALRAELVQVAAVAVQWIEALDRRRATR